MINIQNKLLAILFIAFIYPLSVFSQASVSNELSYEVNRIYPFISISKEKLKEANTLSDLDGVTNKLSHYYKSSWVKEYISVEIMSSIKGETKKALNKNDILSKEQKDIMNRADLGSDISVRVKYLPENNLKHNDIKELNFTFTVDPENEAKYPGGSQALKQYLKENAIDKIPDGSFKDYDLTAIKFTIDENGKISDAHLFGTEYQSSGDEKTNELLLETIRNMPCWEPAAYSNGLKVKQEFVLLVGNMENCMIPVLNIR